MKAIESGTLARPDWRDATLPASSKGRYLRRMPTLLGWDEGRDAHLSYAECTSGTFHGRPMHDECATACDLFSKPASSS